ncbi:MAG: hypothetical protein GAK30_00356 [Paracidovorax wautersii]|uniref:BrnA antitoxin of type II toxin-antitoxin system n=1 Tax=Paracidovorax wautersii TaxID=1177982 RepID=A0A7V8FRZ7_9BURK|nr:MAG: hypothetical protein GAK30_00356 [Paracidovorax wautersii]
MNKHAKKLDLILPTPEEDAAIDAGIAADPDTQEITAKEMAHAQFLRRPGRPVADTPKQPVTIRLSQDVLNHFKASGPGWQTRIDAALREWVATH